MMETEKDETTSCAFWICVLFTEMTLLLWHSVFCVLLIEMKLLLNCRTRVSAKSKCEKTGWITTKPRTCSVWTIFTQWLLFRLYIFIPHCKICEANPTHPKVYQCRRTSDQTKVINTATLQSQNKLLVLWGNMFFETRSSQSLKMEKVYSMQNCRPW